MSVLTMKPPTGKMLSLKQAAERLGMSTRTVLRLIDEHHLLAHVMTTGPTGRRMLKVSEGAIALFLGETSTFQPPTPTGVR